MLVACRDRVEVERAAMRVDDRPAIVRRMGAVMMSLNDARAHGTVARHLAALAASLGGAWRSSESESTRAMYSAGVRASGLRIENAVAFEHSAGFGHEISFVVARLGAALALA